MKKKMVIMKLQGTKFIFISFGGYAEKFVSFMVVRGCGPDDCSIKPHIMKRLIHLTILLSAGMLASYLSSAQQASCPAWGPYIEGQNMGVAGNSEVMYSEVMADNGCVQPTTYYSTLNFNLGPRGGYGGIQYSAADHRNNIFSLWDIQDTTVPQCYAEYAVPGMNISGFGGEGTGLHSDYLMNWTPGVWYATVIRRWSLGDGRTRIGFFMYDFGAGKWTHYITMVTPENNAYLQGNKVGGFLENWNSAASMATRCGYYRNFWIMNADNVWSKPTVYVASAGTGSWGAEAAFNNTAVKVTSCGTTPGPTGNPQFTLSQPGTKPAIAVTADVLGLGATYSNNSVIVSWTTDATKSPQLSYTISVYDNGNLTGTPVATRTVIRPEKRADTVALSSTLPSGTYYVAIQVNDIFNQQSVLRSASFTRTSGGTTWYKIRNVYSNKYLGIENSSTANLAYIVQYANSTSNNLQWKLNSVNNATVLINRNSSKAIDIANSDQTSGVNPIQYTENDYVNQQWNLVPAGSNTYLIQSNLSNHYVLDDPGSSTADGARMIIYAANGSTGSANQQWVLEPVSGGGLAAGTTTAKEVEGTAKGFRLSPNPANETLQVTGLGSQHGAVLLIIRDAAGRAVRKIRTGNASISISLAGLQKGTYSIEQNGVAKQFVKQ